MALDIADRHCQMQPMNDMYDLAPDFSREKAAVHVTTCIKALSCFLAALNATMGSVMSLSVFLLGILRHFILSACKWQGGQLLPAIHLSSYGEKVA